MFTSALRSAVRKIFVSEVLEKGNAEVTVKSAKQEVPTEIVSYVMEELTSLE